MAIPTSTVLLVAAGGVLIYAGFTSRNPLAALKDVSTGRPSPIRNTPSVNASAFTGVSSGVPTGYVDTVAGEGLPALPRAVEQFSGDKYSQTNRWGKGFSDCSSFVGKGLKSLGIKPPGNSTTTAYLASKEWQQVPAGDVQAGDLAISLNHVVVCYGNGYAIGQQNPSRNVQRGKVDDLMYGNKPYIFIRYSSGSSSAPKVANV